MALNSNLFFDPSSSSNALFPSTLTAVWFQDNILFGFSIAAQIYIHRLAMTLKQPAQYIEYAPECHQNSSDPLRHSTRPLNVCCGIWHQC